MPLPPIWLLGVLPGALTGRVLLGLLAAALLAGACHLLARDGTLGRALLCGFLLVGATLPCVLGDLYVMHELWAGVLIALSVVAYGMGRPGWGVATGFAALLIRELAAPYCGLCFILAIAGRRWREAAAWGALAGVYCGWYAAHILQVLPRIAPDAHSHDGGWICLGGAAFVISIVQMNAFLLLLPQWVSAVYFTAAMLGFAGWTAPWGQRAGLTVALYAACLAVVGHPFNQYWGGLLAPLLCLGGQLRRPAAFGGQLWRAGSAASLQRAVAESGNVVKNCQEA